MKPFLRAMAALAIAALGIGCQMLAGIEKAQEIVACVKNSDCKSPSACVDHKCVEPPCADAQCKVVTACMETTADGGCDVAESGVDGSGGLRVDSAVDGARDSHADVDANLRDDADANGVGEFPDVDDAHPQPVNDGAPAVDAWGDALPPNPLTISAYPFGLCSGQTASIAVEVANGTAPFTWTVGSGAATGPIAEVRHTFLTTALTLSDLSLHLAVQDGAGFSAEKDVSWPVQTTPVIITPSEQTGCAGSPYELALATTSASGSPTYLPTDLPAGLTLHGNKVTGTLPTSGSPTLRVKVTDGGCSSEASITINLEAAGHGHCPRILPLELPDPCADVDYPPQHLAIDGGSGHPHWAPAVELPSGMTFDAMTGVIGGTPTAGGSLTVNVTDDEGNKATRTYGLALRKKCWLAYVSGATSSTLQLVDPVLPDLSNRHSFPAALGDASVRDFKFSPDGKFLAYRLIAADSTASLRLLKGPTWTETPVPINGSVSQYEWSENGQTLAISYTSGSAKYLGGVRVAGSNGPALDGGPQGLDGGTGSNEVLGVLDPVSAIGSDALDGVVPDGNLIWLDGPRVAYGLVNSLSAMPFFSSLDSGGFVAPETIGTVYNPPISLVAGRQGFFIAGAGTLQFAGLGGQRSITFFSKGELADPAGKYAIRVKSGALQLLPTGFDGQAPVAAQAPGCGKILAWAKGKERIACVTNAAVDAGPTQAVTRIFDLDEAATSFGSQEVRGEINYTQDLAAARRRAFSPSGDWLALATDSRLDVIAVRDANAPNLSFVVPGSSAAPNSDIAFSPDGQHLVWHIGNRLHWVALASGWNTVLLSGVVFADAPSCSDLFPSNPNNYCGRGLYGQTVAWSSNPAEGRWVAAATASGGLKVFLGHPTESSYDSGEICSKDCASLFRFQP